MEIKGKTAFVTGANRGLGTAFAEALLEAGAAKVYAGARDPASIKDSRMTPVRLDITSRADIAAAVEACSDVNILINNAGAMFSKTVLADDAVDTMRREMDVNVFGVLDMANAFAPVLKRNGGGVMVNMLSVVAWYVYPFNSTYCATKHAARAVTDGLRYQLKSQGTQVIGVEYFNMAMKDARIAKAAREPRVPTLEQIRHVLRSIRRSPQSNGVTAPSLPR
jgi:NAD(P)-dependent dehydrogenase (short-subunit alcohol dehydrogenase family)